MGRCGSKATMVRLHLKWSKCDQFGTWQTSLWARLGSSNGDPQVHCSEGPLARGVLRAVTTQPALKPWFIEQLREVLTAVGLPRQQYAGHSFRIGAATTAAIARVENSTIQTLGRWHSSAYLQYIRLPSEWLARISAVLAKNTGPA